MRPFPSGEKSELPKSNTRREGQPGTTDQLPRWEGPPENRPRGYLPALDDPIKTPDAAGETLKSPDRKDVGDVAHTQDHDNG